MVGSNLFRWCLLLATITAWCLAAGISSAQLQERDFQVQGDAGITYDPLTDLEWLDLSLTTGLSYFDIAFGVGNTWSQDGWRYATASEICALYLA